jgi:hypothetical protein
MAKAKVSKTKTKVSRPVKISAAAAMYCLSTVGTASV